MLMIFIMKCVNLPNPNVYLFQLVIKEVLFLFISFIVKFGVLLLFLMFLGQNGLSFIDDCTRITWIFLLKQKSNVSIVPQNFCSMIKHQFGVKIKRFRSDNARDYFNQLITPYFQREGIIHESSYVNTPQQKIE